MFRHEFAEINGIRLHYVTAGTGKLIMFVHGFPEFWYAWKDQLAAFGREYQAVAPDMRGYNLSAKPADVEQYQMHHLIGDLRALATHLGHQTFILVGHDWGGAVAWALAAREPAAVEKLLIINAPHPNIFARELRKNPAQQRASQYMLTFRSPQAEQMLAADNYAALVTMVLKRGLKQGYFTQADLRAYQEAWAQPGALTGGLNYYRASRIAPPDPSEGPAAHGPADPPPCIVRVPTLVIWGLRDQALLAGNLDGLEAFVADLTIERVPDGSHWIVHEQPERINAMIRSFIEGRR